MSLWIYSQIAFCNSNLNTEFKLYPLQRSSAAWCNNQQEHSPAMTNMWCGDVSASELLTFSLIQITFTIGDHIFQYLENIKVPWRSATDVFIFIISPPTADCFNTWSSRCGKCELEAFSAATLNNQCWLQDSYYPSLLSLSFFVFVFFSVFVVQGCVGQPFFASGPDGAGQKKKIMVGRGRLALANTASFKKMFTRVFQ